jgi:hypothetical protein
LHPVQTSMFGLVRIVIGMLPLNTNGDPEYATVVITVDRTHDDPNAHVDRSKLMSTRTPEGMLEGLAAFYGDTTLMKDYGDVVRECADIDIVYVYRPRRKADVLKIVAGSGGYRALIDHPAFGGGSTLVADRQLLSRISGIERAVGKQRLFLLHVDDMLPSEAALVLEPASPADRAGKATVEAAA